LIDADQRGTQQAQVQAEWHDQHAPGWHDQQTQAEWPGYPGQAPGNYQAQQAEATFYNPQPRPRPDHYAYSQAQGGTPRQQAQWAPLPAKQWQDQALADIDAHGYKENRAPGRSHASRSVHRTRTPEHTGLEQGAMCEYDGMGQPHSTRHTATSFKPQGTGTHQAHMPPRPGPTLALPGRARPRAPPRGDAASTPRRHRAQAGQQRGEALHAVPLAARIASARAVIAAAKAAKEKAKGTSARARAQSSQHATAYVHLQKAPAARNPRRPAARPQLAASSPDLELSVDLSTAGKPRTGLHAHVADCYTTVL